MKMSRINHYLRAVALAAMLPICTASPAMADFVPKIPSIPVPTPDICLSFYCISYTNTGAMTNQSMLLGQIQQLAGMSQEMQAGPTIAAMIAGGNADPSGAAVVNSLNTLYTGATSGNLTTSLATLVLQQVPGVASSLDSILNQSQNAKGNLAAQQANNAAQLKIAAELQKISALQAAKENQDMLNSHFALTSAHALLGGNATADDNYGFP